jgi:hypothetical protein
MSTGAGWPGRGSDAVANYVFNISKGAVAEKIRDGANIQVLVLATAGIESDATLIDVDTVTALVAGTTNEVTNGSYARKSIANASITLTVDDGNDRVDVDIADQTWAAVAAGDGWNDVVICEDVGGGDGTRVPLTQHDFVVTPDGSDITAQVAVFYRAS